ncbi:hypothetical protein [Candidatus Methylacidithermus pantelleriae]|uniref:Uncharacterized protein n=1 Tax=Candidatus Methylacidithermus pantelleriae TaxID=2744239 RepID=A0A8J2BLK2_9BACT|nr:hypothetical protein [Candidatus Methylacidithermus pantelleriae]CAF0699803.1 hypothetical protein MPNT_300002 [Candidatus Methylacidithermus pantelleriae]
MLGWEEKTAGNQSAKLRYPRAAAYGLPLRYRGDWGSLTQYLALESVLRLAYGQEAILQALFAIRMMVTAPTERVKLARKQKRSAVKLPLCAGEQAVAALSERRGATSFLGDTPPYQAVGIDTKRGSSCLGRNGSLLTVSSEPAGLACSSMVETRRRPKRFLLMPAKRSPRPCAESGGPLGIKELDLRKRKPKFESVDCVRARSFPLPPGKAIAMAHVGFFAARVEVIEVDPAYTSVIRAVNHAQLSWHKFLPGGGFGPPALDRGGLGLSERPSVREPVVPGRTLYGRFSGGGSGRESKRGKERMPGLGGQFEGLGRSCPRKRGTGR